MPKRHPGGSAPLVPPPGSARAKPAPPIVRPSRALAIQFGGLTVVAIAVLIVGRLYPLDQIVDWLRAHVDRYKPWSIIAYPFVHAAFNLLLLPGGALVIGCGFFFGLWRGFLLALTGHLLAAACAFWISRRFARKPIERYLASRPQWRALDRAIEREGWKIVFLSQLNPLFPTSLFNYCYGLTRLRFWPTMFWIGAGWSPGMFLYAYLGRLGRFGWQAWQEGGNVPRAQTALWLGGLAVSLGLTVALGRMAMRLLAEARERAVEEEAAQQAGIADAQEAGDTAPEVLAREQYTR